MIASDQRVNCRLVHERMASNGIYKTLPIIECTHYNQTILAAVYVFAYVSIRLCSCICSIYKYALLS